MTETLESPYPYFGGKSKVAEEVWRRFGDDLENYVEPFYGSGAVHLAAPYVLRHETINDLDAFVANFWRAAQAAPDELAEHLNWPVNEADQEARHKWLCQRERKAEFARRVKDDPDYFDVRTAAWWCWGLCCWIGAGWCAGEWVGRDSDENNGSQLNRKNGKRPNLGDAGKGECARRGEVLRDWMNRLCDRLRNVRVCCGDWSRVLTRCPTYFLGLTGVFLDPPYGEGAKRNSNIYTVDSETVAAGVRQWCAENGANALLRIALCGYEGEGHEELTALGWDVFEWEAHGGYACVHGDLSEERSYLNKKRERIWFSPACIVDPTLWHGSEA